MAWYSAFASGANAPQLCLADLAAYSADLIPARGEP